MYTVWPGDHGWKSSIGAPKNPKKMLKGKSPLLGTVVWNMNFPHSVGKYNHPNWRTNSIIFQRVGEKPPSRHIQTKSMGICCSSSFWGWLFFSRLVRLVLVFDVTMTWLTNLTLSPASFLAALGWPILDTSLSKDLPWRLQRNHARSQEFSLVEVLKWLSWMWLFHVNVFNVWNNYVLSLWLYCYLQGNLWNSLCRSNPHLVCLKLTYSKIIFPTGNPWVFHIYNVRAPITMVYGVYNYSYWGESKPTYNWGASHCMLSLVNLQLRRFSRFCGGGAKTAPWATGVACGGKQELQVWIGLKGWGVEPLNPGVSWEFNHRPMGFIGIPGWIHSVFFTSRKPFPLNRDCKRRYFANNTPENRDQTNSLTLKIGWCSGSMSVGMVFCGDIQPNWCAKRMRTLSWHVVFNMFQPPAEIWWGFEQRFLRLNQMENDRPHIETTRNEGGGDPGLK